MTGLGIAGIASAGWLAFGGRAANAYYRGPVSDHFDGRNNVGTVG